MPGQNRKFDAVIFDMDGVIIDSEILTSELYVDYFRTLGLEIEKEFFLSLVGGSGEPYWGAMRLRSGLDTDTPTLRENILGFIRDSDVPYGRYVNPGVPELLRQLKAQGYKLAMATSTERERAMRIVSACGVKDFFDVILTGDMFRESKPNPEIYLRTAAELGVEPSRCAAVEDSAIGIEAALRASMTVIAKREERFHFKQDKAHVIVDEMLDVAGLV